jgi:hypothetical protein
MILVQGCCYFYRIQTLKLEYGLAHSTFYTIIMQFVRRDFIKVLAFWAWERKIQCETF